MRPAHVGIRQSRRQDYFFMHDIRTARIVEDLTGALIADTFTGAISRRIGRATANAASERFDVQVIEGHGVWLRTLRARYRAITTCAQARDEAVFRYPARSGSCSSSEGMSATSVTCCALTCVERREPRPPRSPSRPRPRVS